MSEIVYITPKKPTEKINFHLLLCILMNSHLKYSKNQLMKALMIFFFFFFLMNKLS